MKRISLLLSTLTLWVFAVGAAHGGPLWYNGDFDGRTALSNEQNTSVSDGRTYDDFIVGAGGWHIDTVWSNDLMSFTATTAHWEIRSGVSAGNGGSLLFSGDSAITQTATGRSGFGFSEFTVEVSGLNIDLAAGTYWLVVAPIDSGNGRSFVSTTSGANAIGSPPGNDDNSFFDSTFFGANFAHASDEVGFSPADFSMGVGGTPLASAVPEPASLTLLGIAGATFAGYFGWRRRKLAVA